MTNLRTFTKDELAAILVAHGKWRRGEPGGSSADLAHANLARAYLADADLAHANLARAYLAHANLARANLARAYLARANLAGAYLAGAYLAGADLAGAYLAGAYRSPSDPSTPYVRPTPEELAAHQSARAAAYRERHPEVPVVEALDAKILEAVTAGGGTLGMDAWHTCTTTHCRAGWAITLAGAKGKALENEYGSEGAGVMIYRASTGRVPYFFDTTDGALADIKACAEQQKTAP